MMSSALASLQMEYELDLAICGSKCYDLLSPCYDLATFRGKSSQSFVSSFSLLLILFKFLFRTFENESEEVVNCWVQSSAKDSTTLSTPLYC